LGMYIPRVGTMGLWDHGPLTTDHGPGGLKALKSAKTGAILTAKPMIGGAAKYAK